MSNCNDRMRNSSSQTNITTLIPSTTHAYNNNNNNAHRYAYPPLNKKPLLVVSPTSPVSTPSRLPVVVPRQTSKQAAPVIHCTSWLHPKKGENKSFLENISCDKLTVCKTERTSRSLFSTSRQQTGFRGSKIPVRSARGTHSGLRVDQIPRPNRSRSLTNLVIEDLSSYPSDIRHSASPESSPRSHHQRSHSPTPVSSHRQQQQQQQHQNSKSKNRNESHPTPTSPLHRALRRQSTSCNSYPSLNSLQSPTSPSTSYQAIPTSPRITQRSCKDPSKLSNEPYQTPQYFTFHLTLRSPAKSPSRPNLRPLSRCGTADLYGQKHTEASQAATRCVEDMILQTCAVPSPEMLQSVRLPHSIHMPQVPSCEISIDSCSKGDDSERDRQTANANEIHQEEVPERKPQQLKQEESDIKRSSVQSAQSNSSQATTVESSFEIDSLGTDIHCVNFGIIDYLNTVMKVLQFQDSEQDETESNCSECGSGLAVSPPTRFSDTESTIEPMPVSSDVPLKGFTTFRSSSLIRKKPDLRSLKWRSCQELFERQAKRRLLQRQLSDRALKVKANENNLTGTSVEVYDGNLGVSIITLLKTNRTSSSTLKRPSRRCISATDEHMVKNSFSFSTTPDQQEKEDSTSRVSSSTGERQLIHEESGDSVEYGYHDSLAVEPSDTEYGEQMDIDDYPNSPSEDVLESPPKVLSRQSSCSSSKLQRSPENKYNGSTEQTYNINNKISNTNKPVEEWTGRPIPKIERSPDIELDHVLGIQEDDGTGPGLSEDEQAINESPPANCTHPSPRAVSMVSPHKILWYLQKESRRRSNETSVRRIQPKVSETGKTSMIPPPDYRFQYSGRDQSLRNVSISDTSQPTSAISQPSRLYSDASQGDSSAEDSDACVELSELERCVLSLTHRRNQLRKQDTNAFLIAPPEYKIGDDVSTVPEDPHS